MKAVKKVVEPVTKDGFETLEFDNHNNGKELITKQEAEDIMAADFKCPFEEIEEDPSQTITAWLRVYSPVYNPNVKNWMFEYGKNHKQIDISETDIAEQAMQRGGALLNDTYKVKLQITQKASDSGAFTNHYKILEVLEF